MKGCDRCGKCIEACSQHSIFAAGPQHGPEIELTPLLQVEERACYLCTEVPCASACPTGALVPLAAAAIHIGVAVVMETLCLNAGGEACEVCVTQCPLPGRAIEPTRVGEIPIVHADACTGCGLCVLHCPAYPKAIRVDPV